MDPKSQGFDDVLMTLHGTRWRRGYVHAFGERRVERKVTVPVDESRHQGMAPEVDLTSLGPHEFRHRLLASGGQNAAVLRRQGFDGFAILFECQDGSALVEVVRYLCCGRHGAGAEEQCETECADRE